MSSENNSKKPHFRGFGERVLRDPRYKKSPKRAQMTLRLPQRLLEDMDREAAGLGMTRNSYILHLHNLIGRPAAGIAEKQDRALGHKKGIL